MSNRGLDCPVDFVTMNEYQVRWTALLVLVLTAGYIVSGYWFIPAFLVVDFFLRASKLGKYSLLGQLGGVLVKAFGMGNKPVDRAPKRFAAWIGLLVTGAITMLYGVGASSISYILADILLIFAFLEAAFGFCAGCRVYTLIKPLLPSKSL
ncbi:protein of unknown function [Parapedobacter indicus]|uniref:DUF4395 domain-containing protein n=2 Tax=Parapedobacter indicus TaxID=1477437 RepID=A0A1I3M0L9_9SPHI|nr:uncharacterized protein DUF4395 [Parapedobacter indicus]SFI90554.1 protein of unknown function [Parapedobacter indicus]